MTRPPLNQVPVGSIEIGRKIVLGGGDGLLRPMRDVVPNAEQQNITLDPMRAVLRFTVPASACASTKNSRKLRPRKTAAGKTVLVSQRSDAAKAGMDEIRAAAMRALARLGVSSLRTMFGDAELALVFVHHVPTDAVLIEVRAVRAARVKAKGRQLPDLQNMIEGALDAMAGPGLVYDNDRQFVTLRVRRVHD